MEWLESGGYGIAIFRALNFNIRRLKFNEVKGAQTMKCKL